MTGLCTAASFANATVHTPSNNDPIVRTNSGDSVVVSTYFGPDNNTSDDWVNLDADNLSVSITGTLQGRYDLLRSSTNVNDIEVTISTTGEVVANGQRAFDIDGSGRTVTDLTITNDGTI